LEPQGFFREAMSKSEKEGGREGGRQGGLIIKILGNAVMPN
jgi:hypothetical protein